MRSSSTPRTSTSSRPRRSLPETFALLLFVLSLAVPARGEQDGVVRAYLFYSADCEECKEVKEEILPSLRREYGPSLVIRELDIAAPENYDLLVRFEEVLGRESNEPPVVVLGDVLLGGFDEVSGRLAGEVASAAGAGGCPWPEAGEGSASSPGEAAARVAAFYEFGCKACTRIEMILDGVSRRYPSSSVERHDVRSREEMLLLEAASEASGMPDAQRLVTPVVFVGKAYLIGAEISDGAVAGLIGGSGSGYDLMEEARALGNGASEGAARRLRSYKVLAIISAGLIDGINPCAFATIVFFISYLTLVGRARRELLLVGAFFTLAVFVSYVAIGLGLFVGIRSLSFFPVVGAAFSYGIAVLAFVLGVVSFVDYLRCRGGRASEMILQLPVAAKKRIHSVIRARARLRNYIIASMGIGFLVSLIELVCTGQIYLPTITLMVSLHAFNLRAFLLLLVYNLAFVLPLIGIIILASVGLSAEHLAGFMMRRVAAIKLLSAALFFALAALIFLV